MGDVMGWHKSRKKAKKAAVICIAAFLLLCSTLFLQWAFNKSVPLLLPLARQEFADVVTRLVYESANELNLSETVVTVHQGDGDVSYMRTDAALLNACAAQVSQYIEGRMGDEDIKISIPVGDIVGDALSAGQGPSILVELNQYKSVLCEFDSRFTACGVNQTLHRLTLTVTVSTAVLLPGLVSEQLSVTVTLPIAETVFIGSVPSTYLNGLGG